MTHGTSAHGEGLSKDWADAGRNGGSIAWHRPDGGLASLNLLALGLALGLSGTTAWQAAIDGAPGGHAVLAILIVTGAAAVLIGLRRRDRAVEAPQDRGAPDEPSQLLAQLHHELRTPLNAMIGFSEVMLRELHGPLGHARYQEYAAHISESGGRLLKASEDALAVAATMTALVADRRVLRRERLPAAALVREAWAASGTHGIALSLADCGAIEIECDRQATSQALQHVLGEAIARTPPGGTIAASAGQGGNARRIEISAQPRIPAQDRRSIADDGLRLILARSLLGMQGATLSLSGGLQAEGWSAHIAFPITAASETRRRNQRPSAGARWLTASGHRGDCAAAPAVAARASAQSPAAPPA